jgi:uncharacterized protein YpuA (DUF1002 family)
MTKYSIGKNKVSAETQDEALKIARSTQKPGQTKEQTKLISQGIQKGIDQYKKQHKAKTRDLNKQLKKVKNTEPSDSGIEQAETVMYQTRKLPWILLVFSWLFFVGYFLLDI